MKKLLCLLLAWILLLAGCAAPTGAQDAAALRREVNAKNQAIPTPQTPPEAWLYDYPAALCAQPVSYTHLDVYKRQAPKSEDYNRNGD